MFALDAFFWAWCYLLVGDETLLVDTGVPWRDRAILRAIRATGIDPAKVDRIVLTHFDVDHSGSARALAAALGATVALHAADVPYLAHPSACPARRLSYFGPIPRIIGWRRPRADQVLHEGDSVGGWHVLHTPGHTPGSISLLRDGVLVAGDALVHLRGALRPNRRMLSGDWAAELGSARRLAGLDAQLVLPGHYSPCAKPGALADLLRRLDRSRPPAR
ncbi:MAG: MBL fold metallo-hydrolase [Actinobacteria bacterium]|nr:MBL fold metallo-hydrolase [Actinomycetota bacterium]